MPSETQLVQLAEEVGVSPTRLLVGEGPRYMRELQRTGSLAEAFREHVCGRLWAAGVLDVALESDAGLLPPAVDLLAEVVERIHDRTHDRQRQRDQADRDMMRQLLTDLLDQDDVDLDRPPCGAWSACGGCSSGATASARRRGVRRVEVPRCLERFGLTIIRE